MYLRVFVVCVCVGDMCCVVICVVLCRGVFLFYFVCRVVVCVVVCVCGRVIYGAMRVLGCVCLSVFLVVCVWVCLACFGGCWCMYVLTGVGVCVCMCDVIVRICCDTRFVCYKLCAC